MKSLSYTLLAVAMLLTACSVDLEEKTPADEGQTVHTVILRLEGDIQHFDNQLTRSTTSQWSDEAKLYIQYHTSNGLIGGLATYNQSTDEWTVNYYGTITRGQETQCEVYYFEDAVSVSMAAVVLNQQSVAYSDTQATYLYENGTVTLKAHLRPLTGRIRFRGLVGYQFSLTGLKWYSNYNITDNTLSQQSGKLTLTVGQDGYTPYVYTEFADASMRRLVVDSVDEDDVLSREFDATVLVTGQSGYMDVPTMESYNGWQLIEGVTQKNFKVTGNGKTVTFKMIRVKHGTFQMGRAGSEDVVTPVHQVTLTNSYFMGETEVTQALWYAVMGQSPTSDGMKWASSSKMGDNYPAYLISYEDCQQFLVKLNQLTGQQFRFPTEAEWEFAAKGGTKSLGYIYAGSNTVDDVAWYDANSKDKGNSSPDFGTHAVKSKKANELGLYDMSGNVWEWCADLRGDYSPDAQTNPTGPATGGRVIRGGCWGHAAEFCRVAARNSGGSSSRSYYLGFRLAL